MTTNLIVRTRFLTEHPTVVENLLRAHVEVTDYINANAAQAKALLNRHIENVTSAALPAAVIDAAWEHQKVTFDPIASSLKKSADDAFALGYLDKKPDLSKLYDLALLNKVLGEKMLPGVQGL